MMALGSVSGITNSGWIRTDRKHHASLTPNPYLSTQQQSDTSIVRAFSTKTEAFHAWTK